MLSVGVGGRALGAFFDGFAVFCLASWGSCGLRAATRRGLTGLGARATMASSAGQVAGGGPNAARAARTIVRPSSWLPTPPTTAPIPNGMIRPTIEPVWVTIRRGR